MKSLDAILDLLSDGKRHLITEIAIKLGVDELKMTLAVAFLERFGFIEAVGNYIKITPEVQQFLKQIRGLNAHSSSSPSLLNNRCRHTR